MKKAVERRSTLFRAASALTRCLWRLTPRFARRRVANAGVAFLRRGLEEDESLRERLLEEIAFRVATSPVDAGTVDKNVAGAKRDLRRSLGDGPELEWASSFLDEVAARARTAGPAGRA